MIIEGVACILFTVGVLGTSIIWATAKDDEDEEP